VRRPPPGAPPLALDPLAAAHTGRALRVLPLLRGALRGLLRVLYASRREARALRPLRFPAGSLLQGAVPPGGVPHPPRPRLRGRDGAAAPVPRDLFVLHLRARSARLPLDGGLEPVLSVDGALRARRRVPGPDRHPSLPVDARAVRGAVGLLRLERDSAERLPA